MGFRELASRAILFVCVCVGAYRPSQQFCIHVGTEPTLPEFNQYCRELMCLAQGHHGNDCGDRTQDLSIRSPMLYHYPTALSTAILFSGSFKIFVFSCTIDPLVCILPGPFVRGV